MKVFGVKVPIVTLALLGFGLPMLCVAAAEIVAFVLFDASIVGRDRALVGGLVGFMCVFFACIAAMWVQDS